LNLELTRVKDMRTPSKSGKSPIKTGIVTEVKPVDVKVGPKKHKRQIAGQTVIKLKSGKTTKAKKTTKCLEKSSKKRKVPLLPSTPSLKSSLKVSPSQTSHKSQSSIKSQSSSSKKKKKHTSKKKKKDSKIVKFIIPAYDDEPDDEDILELLKSSRGKKSKSKSKSISISKSKVKSKPKTKTTTRAKPIARKKPSTKSKTLSKKAKALLYPDATTLYSFLQEAMIVPPSPQPPSAPLPATVPTPVPIHQSIVDSTTTSTSTSIMTATTTIDVSPCRPIVAVEDNSMDLQRKCIGMLQTLIHARHFIIDQKLTEEIQLSLYDLDMYIARRLSDGAVLCATNVRGTTFNVESVRCLEDILEKIKATDLILVHHGGITSSAKTALVNQKKINTTIFPYNVSTSICTQHKAVPKHEALDKQQEADVLKRFRLKDKTKFSLLCRSDPVVKFHGWPLGTLVKIIKHPGQATEPLESYRVVSPDVDRKKKTSKASKTSSSLQC
jgi:DNA-directed RNA polymerase subunit H (RpoH/RPB5)